MAYITPRVLIDQEFTQNTIFSDAPLAACIVGPNYDLARYDVAAEKSRTELVHPDTPELGNEYQAGESVAYPYPDLVPATLADATYTKLYAEDAVVQYLPNVNLGSTDTEQAGEIKSDSTGVYFCTTVADAYFKDLTGFELPSYFGGRDVKAGDVVDVYNGSSLVGSTEVVSVLRSIPSLFSEEDISITAPVQGTTAQVNTAGRTYGAQVGTIGGTDAASFVIATNGVKTAVSYHGVPAKGITEDVITLTALDRGDGLSEEYNVHSASGAFADYTVVVGSSSTSFSVYNDAGPFTVTTYDAFDGVIKLFEDGSGVSDIAKGGNYLTLIRVNAYDSSDSLMEAGETITVTLKAPYVQLNTAGELTLNLNSSEYPTTDGQIRIEVVRGGFGADVGTANVPLFRVSGAGFPVQITGFGETGTIPLGNYSGITFTTLPSSLIVSGSNPSWGGAATIGAYHYGDVWTIDVSAYEQGGYTVLKLKDSFTEGVRDIVLKAKISSVEVPKLGFDGNSENYTADFEEVTASAAIDVPLEGMTLLGSTMKLPLLSGNLFATYRSLLTANSTTVNSISDITTVEDVLGAISNDNPLAEGVYAALLNAGSTAVYYVPVATDDLAGYTGALVPLEKTNKTYGIVPLTHDTDIIDLFVSHVNTQSTNEKAKWRVLWVSRQMSDVSLLTEGSSATNSGATVTAVGSEFITSGVRSGDVVRYAFSTDENGVDVYESGTVLSVASETVLTLTDILDVAIAGSPIEVYRTLTKQEKIDTFKLQAGGYDNRRVRSVYPDTAKRSGVEKPGYFVASALAGLRGSVVPHQGLTNTTLLGFDDVSKTLTTFTETQMNELAEQGIFIVTQDVVGGTPYVRHQLTTDMSGFNQSEDSITSNVDHITFGLYTALAPYIGIYNRTREALALIRASVVKELNHRKTGTFTQRAGNQLSDYVIDKLEFDATFKDRVNIEVTLDVPGPINTIKLKLTV